MRLCVCPPALVLCSCLAPFETVNVSGHGCVVMASAMTCEATVPRCFSQNCHPERRAIGREHRERLKEPEAEGSWFRFSATTELPLIRLFQFLDLDLVHLQHGRHHSF